MYRVGNDPRTQRSAQMILNGLTECLKVKEFPNVSVTDIHKASGVSRATFYRLFDIPLDVLVYACDKMSEEFSDLYDKIQNKGASMFLKTFLKFLTEHCDLLEAIFRSRHSDILENSMLNLKARKHPEMSNSPVLEYMNAISCAAIISLLMVWIRRGRKETPDELYRMFATFRSERFK